MCQLGLELDKEWATVKPGQRRFKRRRISASSWKFAQMYVEYQQQIKAEREASASPQLSHEGVCQSDHPPQNIYTDSFFRGGVITEESQVEQVEMFTLQLDGSIQLCDGDFANLITPPSIYIQTPFLGGGDQDLSQGVGEQFGESVPTAEEGSIEKPIGIRVGSVVKFTNPDRLEHSKAFEGIRMRIKQIVADVLAFCQLPDGSEETFGLHTLVPVTS
jgi:hypothetical protein